MTDLIVFLIIFSALIFTSFVLKKENERNAKLDKEDKILHELTACRKD